MDMLNHSACSEQSGGYCVRLQVFPGGIPLADEFSQLLRRQLAEVFLPDDDCKCVGILLVIDQAQHGFARVSLAADAWLIELAKEIVSHANSEYGPTGIRQQINKVVLFHAGKCASSHLPEAVRKILSAWQNWPLGIVGEGSLSNRLHCCLRMKNRI